MNKLKTRASNDKNFFPSPRARRKIHEMIKTIEKIKEMKKSGIYTKPDHCPESQWIKAEVIDHIN